MAVAASVMELGAVQSVSAASSTSENVPPMSDDHCDCWGTSCRTLFGNSSESRVVVPAWSMVCRELESQSKPTGGSLAVVIEGDGEGAVKGETSDYISYKAINFCSVRW